MDKNLLWTGIVEPIVNSLTDNGIEEVKNVISDFNKEKFKLDFYQK